MTQEFFARLLAKKYFQLADRTRGKFRSFLLTALKHFLVNEWRKEIAGKRGGSQPVLSWDQQEAEGRYLAEPADELTPEKVFEKRWAILLLEQVLARLREESAAAGKAALFEELKHFLWGEKSSYTELASRLEMSEGALRVAVHRLRQRSRELLRAEVAQTVASPKEIDEELRYLVQVLST